MPQVRCAAIAVTVVALVALVAPGPAAAIVPAEGFPRQAVGLAVLPRTAIVPGSVDRSSLEVEATYDAVLRLATRTRRVRTSVTITATNRSGAGIDRLELNTVMARLGGRLAVGPMTVDGLRVTPVVEDQTLVVPLGGILPPGATTVVRLSVAATLRPTLAGSAWLFARANGIVDLYRWLPWISRRTPFDRPNHGDPFVTPVSPRVRVTVTTDVPLVLAATGRRTEVSADGLTQVFEAGDVRDVTISAAADYRSVSATAGGTLVRVLHRPGTRFPASRALAAARRALVRLEARLGPYPYPQLVVAQSAGAYGMEGPGVVWIPTGVPASNLEYLVTHEVAHQWFYGIVGNDQARDPFADEAAADFLARNLLALRRASRCAPGRLDRPIDAYSTTCYYERVYIQGGNLLDDARRRMGPAAFWAALRGYVADHRFGLSDTRTLLEALDAGTPEDLGAWWGARFPSLYGAGR